MPLIVIVGTQWGDEGKGKVVHSVAQKAQAVVRFGGGANAGHSLELNGKRIVVRLCPSGITTPGVLGLVGPGVVCDPEVLIAELKIAKAAGSRVLLDRDASVVLPLHKLVDAAREKARGSQALGTTKNGIGPAYEDLKARREFRLRDLATEASIRKALKRGNLYIDRAQDVLRGGLLPPSFEELVAWCLQFKELLEYLGDSRAVVEEMLDRGDVVVAEGAQGFGLDEDNGTRPCCTSSSSVPAGFSKSFGIYRFSSVIGIAKAYGTRVGEGIMPTLVDNEWSQRMQDLGQERGSVTGRVRRVGAIDLPYLEFACRRGGITHLVITKLDLLTGDKIPVCDGYLYKNTGMRVEKFTTLTTEVLESVDPQITEMDGWSEPIGHCRRYEEMPQQAQAYLRLIETSTGVPIMGVGVGPDRDAIIWRDSLSLALSKPEG